jgi:hypothetical protein
MEINQRYLQVLFSYDAETGHLYWKVRRGRCAAGKRAGNIMKRGYRQVAVDGRTYYEHRIIWMLVNGPFEGDIDHINCDRADNRLENLRVATRSQNLARIAGRNKQGLPKGVYLAKGGKSYSARTRRVYLGSFPTIEEAVAARNTVCRVRYGDFAD